MRRVLWPVLVLAVFLPSIASARARFFCDVDLIVRDSCCCPPKQVKQAPAHPTMQRVCCSVEKRTAAPLPSATPPGGEPTPVPVLVAVAMYVPPAPASASPIEIVARAQAPPPERSLLSQFRGLLL